MIENERFRLGFTFIIRKFSSMCLYVFVSVYTAINITAAAAAAAAYFYDLFYI